jgi:hypothetical protein
LSFLDATCIGTLGTDTAKGAVSGAAYRYLDRTARRGVAYRYRVKAVQQDGTARWFGPVRAQ